MLLVYSIMGMQSSATLFTSYPLLWELLLLLLLQRLAALEVLVVGTPDVGAKLGLLVNGTAFRHRVGRGDSLFWLLTFDRPARLPLPVFRGTWVLGYYDP